MSRVFDALELSRTRDRGAIQSILSKPEVVFPGGSPGDDPRPIPFRSEFGVSPPETAPTAKPSGAARWRVREASPVARHLVEHGFAMGEKLATHPLANPILVEQFRKLAGVLHHAQLEHSIRTVTIASALPREGKTLTAINLALTLAQSYGRRVLLIDADLRDPSVHTALDCPRAPGVTDLMSGDTDAEVPIVGILPRLSVITAGAFTADPISALSSDRFRQLVADLATRFEWIVLDIPPVGALPDARLLTSLSDTTVLVVQAGCASYPIVQRAAEAIGADRILGVVLNQVVDGEIGATYGGADEYPAAPAL